MNSSQLIADRFELQDLLGRGGMGNVYRATDTQTGETVAVKALTLEVLVRDPSLLERFVREGEALRQLNHPNIVRMITAVEEEEHHYLVMEFIEGGSLRDLLKTRGNLPASEVVKIALEVSDALTRAHHLKIIHRDLKPANVLLAKDGTPRLADFGIAHIQDSSQLTQSGVLIGTVDYLSPEVCQGDPPNELSDIWAFGVMLFEMLSGKLPFEGKSMTAKITAILHQPIPDLSKLAPNIPDTLVDLIYHMLEKDSRQRIPSVRLVAAELEGILKGRKPASSGVATSFPSSAFEDTSISGRPVFVGREQELKQLDKSLSKTITGHGQVAFIIGDPGQGKTALLQEFGRRAQKTHAGLVLASGNCNAYTGIGDPYLPFREIMGMLTGDVETLKEAGVIGQTQATRLWNTFPFVIQHLIESGNNLVDIFVSGADLLQRSGSIPIWPEREKWLPQLEGLVARKASQNVDPSLQQAALFEQFTRLARALAQHAPIILLLDDLQWADSGSINLLLHLGKRLEGSRVMVLGAYRPTDVALGRGGERHPLEAVLNELKRQFGEIQVDLSKAEARAFVNSFLDTESNRLDESFRNEFFRISGGHPLTTIELLRDMQERGGLVKDADGRWIVGQALNWETLPVRVEATIAERMGRLDEQELSILRVASVQGEGFSMEVVARVLGVGEAEVVSRLSRNLDREHHLVSAQGIRQINDQRMSFYRFRHILFQKYLYNSFDPVECAHLHQQVGNTLQELYGKETEEIAVQLATHFQKAGTNLEAADYLNQAGDRASGMIAHEEAIEHYQQAISAYKQTLGDRWDPLQQAILERKIGEAFYRRGEHQVALDHLHRGLRHLGYPLPISRWGVRWAIFNELVQQASYRLLPYLFLRKIPNTVSQIAEEELRFYELFGIIDSYINLERALLDAVRALNRSEQEGIHYGVAKGYSGVGFIVTMAGIFRLARLYHERALALARQMNHKGTNALTYYLFGIHLRYEGDMARAIEYEKLASQIYRELGDMTNAAGADWHLAHILFCQGDFDQSMKICQDWVELGHEAAIPQLEGYQLVGVARAEMMKGQLDEAIDHLQQATTLIVEYSLTYTEALGWLSWCYMRKGDLKNAFAQLKAGLIYCDTHHPYGHNKTPLYNGSVQAYLMVAERSENSEKDYWLKQALLASRRALKLGSIFHPGKPEAMRLRGTYEWLKGKPDAARKWWQKGLAMAEKQREVYDLASIHAEMGLRFKDKIHLEHAMEIFSQIGAQWDLEQTQKALSKL